MQDAAALQGLNVCALMHNNYNALSELIWTHFDVGTSLMLFVTNIRMPFLMQKTLVRCSIMHFFSSPFPFSFPHLTVDLIYLDRKNDMKTSGGEILQNICCLFIIWILISKKCPIFFIIFCLIVQGDRATVSWDNSPKYLDKKPVKMRGSHGFLTNNLSAYSLIGSNYRL